MFSMWACGWCTALAVSAIIEGKYSAAALDIGLALFNGLLAYANWRSKK